MGIILLIVAIIVQICVGIGFGTVAEKKGYDKTNWTVATVLIGVPVWLLVIALPNNKQHEELLSAMQRIQKSNQNKVSHISQSGTVHSSKPSDDLPEL